LVSTGFGTIHFILIISSLRCDYQTTDIDPTQKSDIVDDIENTQLEEKQC